MRFKTLKARKAHQKRHPEMEPEAEVSKRYPDPVPTIREWYAAYPPEVVGQIREWAEDTKARYPDPEMVRTFASGATRDKEDGKHEYDGFTSVQVEERFGAYMDHNRYLKDGSLRSSRNWKLGIDRDAYLESLLRHVRDVRKAYRSLPGVDLQEALCGVLFNAQGLLFEELVKASGNRENG